jgi:hypothetical protein
VFLLYTFVNERQAMSNKAPKQPKSQTKRQRGKETPPNKAIFRRVLKFLIAGIGIVASLLAFVALIPRVSVPVPSAAADPNNILSSSFEITNTGHVPLNDVSVKIAAGYIYSTKTGNGIHGILKGNGAPKFNITFELKSAQHHHLGLDDKITINPESNLTGFVDQADIAIIVEYQPWVIPIRREKYFRFIAMKDWQGNTYWRSWPVDEPAPNPYPN